MASACQRKFFLTEPEITATIEKSFLRCIFLRDAAAIAVLNLIRRNVGSVMLLQRNITRIRASITKLAGLSGVCNARKTRSRSADDVD